MSLTNFDPKPDPLEMREAYVDALLKEAVADDRIVVIDCDLGNSCGTARFRDHFPKRYFNVGIAEQNGCALAAGLSVSGLIPFFHSFAIFSTRRTYDQLFVSCAYAGQNVKIIGFDAGISAASHGGTHMAFEDVSIMRTIPGLTVIEPTDAVMMGKLVHQMAVTAGVHYLRSPRKPVERLYGEDQEFEIGKGILLQDGGDVTIIASGMMVAEAIKATRLLQKESVSVRVIDLFTVKPIDQALIIESANRTGAVVTAENSFLNGGLGSAVAEVLVEHCPVPLERIGINDHFGEVGNIAYLREEFGLSAAAIARAARRAINRKS